MMQRYKLYLMYANCCVMIKKVVKIFARMNNYCLLCIVKR